MSIYEKWFLAIIVLMLTIVAIVGFRQSNWSSATQSASVLIASAVLVDSAITRRDSRLALEATLAESRRTQESTDRPLVIFQVTRRSNIAYLSISNHGTAPASRIQVKLDEYPESSTFNNFWLAPMFSKELAFLTPGQEISMPFDRLGGNGESQSDWWRVIRGSVLYAHALDEARTFTSPIALDFQRFEGTHYSSTEDPTLFGARQLEKIARDIHAIARK